jgi:K+-sensing histidine kinase KdpD
MTVGRRFTPRWKRRRGRVRFAMPAARLRLRRGSAGLVSAVSHDFAQPLATVTSLADLLATDWRDLSDDVRHDLAVRVNATAGALSARYRHMVVVMDVLSGRARSGTAVDVRESIRAVIAEMPGHEPIGVSGPAAGAVMDRDHLEHVLATLIADALAHGAPPVRVRVVPDAETVRIEVCDHGPDITRRIQAHILSPVTGHWTHLAREAPRSRALGLAIAALLVSTDGGAVAHRPMRRHRGGRVIIRLAAVT